MSSDIADGTAARPSLTGEWRMQRGRQTDRYRLADSGGVIGGEVDAGAIAGRIPVTGTIEDGMFKLSWKSAGASAISEDARAQYEFRFEGTVMPDAIEGRAVMTGHHLAKGARVPVEEKFQAVLKRVVENPLKNQ